MKHDAVTISVITKESILVTVDHLLLKEGKHTNFIFNMPKGLNNA